MFRSTLNEKVDKPKRLSIQFRIAGPLGMGIIAPYIKRKN